MKQRIQKILSASGAASRRKAESLILAGRVTVNGAAAALGDSADPETDEILLDGRPLAAPPRLYIMLNKPRGYVTSLRDEKGRKTAAELVDCGQRVYPVGRLDMDSEGLLLLTNDGELANALLHPSRQVDKTYRVWVTGATAAGIRKMGTPLRLDGTPIAPASVTLLRRQRDRALLEISIHQGKNRQIRRMAALCGMEVTRLRRIREGPLELGKLPAGQWRFLTEAELAALKNLHKKT